MACLTLAVVDGDTVKCDGVSLRPIGNGAVDVEGFDTPEKNGRAKCLAEKMLSDLAEKRMTEYIKTPNLTIEDTGAVDQFKRPLVVLRLPDGSTVGQHLIDEGYAQKWLPRHKIDWCKTTDKE